MNAVSLLNIKKHTFIKNRIWDDIVDPIDKAIDKYEFHTSILLTLKHLENPNNFPSKIFKIGDILLRRQ